MTVLCCVVLNPPVEPPIVCKKANFSAFYYISCQFGAPLVEVTCTIWSVKQTLLFLFQIHMQGYCWVKQWRVGEVLTKALCLATQINNAKCQQCQMSTMPNINNAKCQQCQMSTMSNVNNVNKIKCQQCQMITVSNLPRTVEICPDLLRSPQICWNPTRSIKMLWDLSDNVKMSTKLSKCQSNYQNVNQIVKMSIKLSKCQLNCQIVTISNILCYQSV